MEQLVGFIANDVPLELVIAIDVSGSVKADMPAQGCCGGTSVGLHALEKLESWGGTAFYDAVILALDAFGRRPDRKALVVFSHGEDQGNRAVFTDVQRRVGDTEALIYMVRDAR